MTQPSSPQRTTSHQPKPGRLPTIYLPHGGGPWPFVELGFGPPGMWDGMRRYLENLVVSLPQQPRAIISVSAHWEEPVPTLGTAAHPPMLYDYYGFPEAAYRITWPAPGSPELATRVAGLLAQAGIESGSDGKRGFDHGTFVPLKLAVPAADIPTVQLSLIRGLDPARHIALGRALAPLRDEGVLIVGSGMSYHNMRGFGRREALNDSQLFDGWMAEVVQKSAVERERALVDWAQGPAARACHPREEHLLPLHVVAGAAGSDRATLPYRDRVMNVDVSAVHFG
ncbi:MAG TPA: class III extradiol ring-cleavage dioxygenase [Polyangiaceae bacterium]|nr:class III extradiol ring-cleavage dioxygenase [Polyangiaceae bacterium]